MKENRFYEAAKIFAELDAYFDAYIVKVHGLIFPPISENEPAQKNTQNNTIESQKQHSNFTLDTISKIPTNDFLEMYRKAVDSTLLDDYLKQLEQVFVGSLDQYPFPTEGSTFDLLLPLLFFCFIINFEGQRETVKKRIQRKRTLKEPGKIWTEQVRVPLGKVKKTVFLRKWHRASSVTDLYEGLTSFTDINVFINDADDADDTAVASFYHSLSFIDEEILCICKNYANINEELLYVDLGRLLYELITLDSPFEKQRNTKVHSNDGLIPILRIYAGFHMAQEIMELFFCLQHNNLNDNSMNLLKNHCLYTQWFMKESDVLLDANEIEKLQSHKKAISKTLQKKNYSEIYAMLKKKLSEVGDKIMNLQDMEPPTKHILRIGCKELYVDVPDIPENIKIPSPEEFVSYYLNKPWLDGVRSKTENMLSLLKKVGKIVEDVLWLSNIKSQKYSNACQPESEQIQILYQLAKTAERRNLINQQIREALRREKEDKSQSPATLPDNSKPST